MAGKAEPEADQIVDAAVKSNSQFQQYVQQRRMMEESKTGE